LLWNFVRVKMSREAITVGSTMRISLLYRGVYSQWRERFMHYLEEQIDGEAMINSIQNGDQPLHVIAPVSLAGTAQNASPTIKDPKFQTAEEKKIRKIDLQTPGSGISILLAVGTPSTGSGNLYCQWELSPGSGNALRLGHLNFKTMNKLVRHNLVRGLPTKCFENDHTCTACLKGKQHKASLTDDFSRFTWTFFLKSKDETSSILKKFITKIENLKDLKVKIIRCDNGGEFRNKEIKDFCSQKGIKREFSNARTPQQNGVAERRNRTLIETSRTMVLVNKSHNKTPYELFNGRSPAIGFLKPFACHVMILNTLDNLGKFEEKGDEGTISTNLLGTKDATGQEVKKDTSSLRYIALPNWTHDALLEFSSSKPQDHCSTEVPEGSRNPNPTASTSNPPADQMETLIVETPIPTVSSPVPTTYSTDSQEPSSNARLISKRVGDQEETPSLDNILSLTNRFEDILGVTTNSDESNRVEADISNIETTITASPTPTLRIHKDHPKTQIIGPVDTSIQTRNKSKEVGEQSFIVIIHQKTDLALLQFCLFSCFLSQVEPKKISDALQDPSWVEAMQEELL
nr:hypothetical protein [Tanacetum cinerariifolium]